MVSATEKMRSLTDLSLETEYRTGERDLVKAFYRPCIAASTNYDRAVGYFRSSILVIAGGDLFAFADRGGYVRLVCSPDLTDDDIKALETGYEQRQEILSRNLILEIDRLVADASTREPTIALASLVAASALDIRIALRTSGTGIFHEKLGIFTDANANLVSFKGSSNETWSAWHEDGNLESFEVFRSWIPDERIRIEKHLAYMEKLWAGTAAGIETLRMPDAPLKRLRALAQERRTNNFEPQQRDEPSVRPLMSHQSSALAAWIAAGSRGILQHATGSGKTVTALEAIRTHVSLGDPALVLVPSELLFKQWRAELIRLECAILEASGNRTDWRQRGKLETFTKADRKLGPRIVLATMQTAARPDFQKRVRASPQLLLVADEVHRLGSALHRTILAIDAGRRLGLSATPVRFGDPEGTSALLTYFGGIINPPFTLTDAIAAGRLVPYTYHPHSVFLTEAEATRFKELTRRIRRDLARLDGDVALSSLDSSLKNLLIRRARIVKKAENKTTFAVELLRREFTAGDSWLVYCEDTDQLEAIAAGLDAVGLASQEYHSTMTSSPGDTLRWFTEFGGILLSIRCLDEGVDIPSVSHALILASSQNPRQFIQRRGRVLRVDPQNALKTVAVIHDAIVTPPDGSSGGNEQDGLAYAELARAIEFASTALNRSSSSDLMRIAINAGLDTKTLAFTGWEDE
jgi:superfamily II DNA or RNA helicase